MKITFRPGFKVFFYKSQLLATYSSAHTFFICLEISSKDKPHTFIRKSDLIQVHFKSLSKTMSLIETRTLRRKTKENSVFRKKIQNWISHYAMGSFSPKIGKSSYTVNN